MCTFTDQFRLNERKEFRVVRGSRLRFLLHCSYNLPNVTSQEIRRVMETVVATEFTEEQKAGVAHYMAHSTPVANAHYRMKTLTSIVTTCKLLSSLGWYVPPSETRYSNSLCRRIFLVVFHVSPVRSRSSSSDESSGDRGDQTQGRGRDDDAGGSGERRDLATFLQTFQVSLTGHPPTKKQRAKAGFPTDRTFFNEWKALQYGQREQYLLCKSKYFPLLTKITYRTCKCGQ